ncbi:E3 ubiquitin-protein ligase TTC3 [Nematolebias whitei]|uniref:E3 ubiquitin-protein ligase TTC3 n=1 Tax=Nematolebias whitei TaxID=451745 RepID=UPI00189B2CED|nr:E3 ubiquitin-protein ligase TTC3 [Nematolebias whitei]
MSDSDSDSDSEWEQCSYVKFKGEEFGTFSGEHILARWNTIPVKTRREASQRMKVCVFWLPIVLQPDNSRTYDWALDIGLINSKDRDELTLLNIIKIQIVESLLCDVEKVTLEKDVPKVLFYCDQMNMQFCSNTLKKALKVLEKSKDPFIRHHLAILGIPNSLLTLNFIFSEFARFIQEMSHNVKKTLADLMVEPDELSLGQSESMKKIGNEYFKKQLYEQAVKYYSKAIQFYPDNHILYGNRALCYIKIKEYLKAAVDGKCAVLIQPLWAKGHYRYCEALFHLDQYQIALEANETARLLCKDNPDGLEDLEQQYQRLELAEMSKPEQSQPQSTKSGARSDRAKPTKVKDMKKNQKTVKTENSAQSPSKPKVSTPSKSEKGELNTPTKKKLKRAVGQENQVVVDRSKAELCKELRSLVQDAHSALYDLRSRNAEQAFSQALNLLETVTPKELGLSTLDELLLLFGRVSALTDIGQPEELAETENLLNKMRCYEERTFQCLVFYAAGRLFLRENRFAMALQPFLDSLQMVKTQITPGKLTWPLTKEVVKETQPEYFKDILERSIELCKFPPPPDAVCRLEKCLCPLKTEIFLTDPDFKGYVQMGCCQSCRVEFHINCWKSLKTTRFLEKSEKDILHETCVTPDCIGKICAIKIFCPTGLVKCKFEAAITKTPMPKKPKVIQKCASPTKLKSNEEQKLKNKRYKELFQDPQIINDEILQQRDDSGTQRQQKALLVYRDPVLLQINQNMDLLREEKCLHVTALTSSLKPWLELDLSRGNQIAARLLNWEQEPLVALSQAVELLLERKNRVWGRVLIQHLSSCVEINPKLSSWACQLNDAGLNAARTFIDRYAEHLEQQDLTLLLHFEPLKEMILEKLSAIPELFSSTGLAFTEYLKQAPTQDTRLFIWTLEEYREEYDSCHAILDEYFDMMDGHGSVLKKSNENNSMSAKCRGRKKKQKCLKSVIGMRGVTDQDYFEDDSLSFLPPDDPFSVPSHLREQVADFENQYSNSRTQSHLLNILDNNSDPTKESLFDYFAQILEEHGPLVAEDPLLVEEMQHFPAMARWKIQEAGGFEAFLLESLRFIKIGRCIGLAKHAVSLQQAAHGASLDDLDEITDRNSSSPDLYTASHFTNYLQNYSSAHAENTPVLPNPNLFYSQSSGSDPYSLWTDSNVIPNPYEESPVDALDTHFTVLEADPTSEKTVFMPKDENFFQRHAEVQTCPEERSCVAVNTEHYGRFERRQGDLTMKERDNIKLEQMIKKMKNGVKVDDRKDLDLLNQDLKTVTINIQEIVKDVTKLQQRLEEEVKGDKKEKKANQEELKALKKETEKLLKEQATLSQNIREKKTSCEAQLTDFLELSNQSTAEKMSLEDEIKRCRSLLASATRRSHTARLSVVESTKDQSLYGLHRELTDSKALLTQLDEAARRNPNQHLEKTVNTCRAKVEEMEKNISVAERRFQEELDRVTSSSRTDAAAVSVGAGEFTPQASCSAAPPPPVGHAAPPAAEAPVKHQKTSSSVFEKAMESLTAMFPDCKRPDLMKYIQEVRLSRGGSLNSMALQDVVGGVTQRILDNQDRLHAARASSGDRSSPAERTTSSPTPRANQHPAWQLVAPKIVRNPLNVEDPCIICHDDMSPDETCVLECRHSFHYECIRSWLNEKNTCPTCRNHAMLPGDFPTLMPGDFPVLLGRRRQVP